MDAVASLVAGAAERDQVLVRIAPRSQLVTCSGAPVILAVMDLQAGASSTIAAGMSIP